MKTDSLYDNISSNIIQWWQNNKTLYPWRPVDGAPNPYHVWLSEIMLQQTTVGTVATYFTKFIQKWPSLEDLASSSLEDIFVQWQGLGYYSRARNLHKAAGILKHHFPRDEAGLQKIPGIGPYTSAAIVSIAFNKHAVVIDGNVKRVVSRLFGLEGEKSITEHATALTPHQEPGDYAQGIMDFGRLVCRPKNPLCPQCPLKQDCYAALHGLQATYPIKTPKPLKQQQYAAAFVALKDNSILLQEQNDKKLLQNLLTLPMTPWTRDQEWEDQDALKQAPFDLDWELSPVQIKHEFTHITLRVKVFKGALKASHKGLIPLENLPNYPISTLVKKIIQSID